MSVGSRKESVAVMGAGAVGCYYGGMLARAGHPVTMIGRKPHADAMNASGLRVERADFDELVPVIGSTSASAVRGAKVVLFCVKSPDTEKAGAEMKAHLDPDAAVLSLQNGVDNAERLAAALGREVIPAVVYVATEMAGPGHVRHHGRGELVIAPSPQSQRLVDAFAAAGIGVEISDNVIGALWAKLIVNCSYNALSAITQLPYGKLIQGEHIRDVMRDVIDECLAVAKASGVTVPGNMHEMVPKIADAMPGQYSSTAQDLARHKPTEIEHLNGFVLAKGAALRVPTPVNRTVLALVRLLETKKP